MVSRLESFDYLIDIPAKDDGPSIHIDESTRSFQSAHETVNHTVLEAEQDINQNRRFGGYR